MKKFLGPLLFVLGVSTSYAEYNDPYSSNRPPRSSSPSYDSYSQYNRQNNQQEMPQGNQQEQNSFQYNAASSECSHLSEQERAFATQLSSLHRVTFCRHFSTSQRIEAMTLVSSSQEGKIQSQKQITPDEAVELILRNSREDRSNSPQQQERQEMPKRSYQNYSYPKNN